MAQHKIHIDVDPIGKPRMTQRDRWKQRPAVSRYHDYKDILRLSVPRGYEVPAELTIQFSLAMPASWSKKERISMLGKPHQQKPDIDNLVKAFLDTLCEEDSYVWSVNASKVWSERGGITIIE